MHRPFAVQLTKIGSRISMHTKIIAEVAQGYEGEANYCALYVRAAAKAGADAVKFQVVFADDLSEPGHEYYELYQSLEMAPSVWREVREQADKLGIEFVIDIFGEQSLAVARDCKPDGIKLHASDFFNRSLLWDSFALATQVFVSVGGIAGEEIDQLVDEVTKMGQRDRLVLLTGFQAEPTPIARSNLLRLKTLRERHAGVQVGYLDHAQGDSEDQTHLSVMAMTLGADWIEKHITLSRYLEFEDYISALEPDEFAVYMATLNRLDPAFGDGDMTLSEDERRYRGKSVKKLLTARQLAAGQQLEITDLVFARTGRVDVFEGFHDPAMVIGKSLSCALEAREPLLAKHLNG